MTETNQMSVVVLEPDPLLATRFTNVIREQGGHSIVVETPADFVAAVDRAFPVVGFVDLQTAGDWQGAIARSKLRPHTRSVPIYAFTASEDPRDLQAARAAGADYAWPYIKLAAELTAVVDRHLRPPVRYPEGWDDRLVPKARAGVEEFNQGDFFEQHELFEEAWMEETRPIRDMYQGILQVGVAFFQIEQGNWAGAIKMFRRGLPRLRDLPPVCQGINVAALRTAAEAIHIEIVAYGPDRLAEFDQNRFPKIEYLGS